MIGEKDLAIVGKMLDFHTLRQRLTAHNIANAEVRGFRRLTASFDKELLRAIEEGDVGAVRGAEFHVKRAAKPGVDPESEMAEMAKNELLFNTFAEIAQHRLRSLRAAINAE